MIGDNADTSIGMGVIGRMQVVVCCERVPPLYLCTPERQSLCESHRRRRWLTCWSYDGRLVHTRAAVPLVLPLARSAARRKYVSRKITTFLQGVRWERGVFRG